MSKDAKLPDGTVLRFPNDTPDEAIDAAVQAHIRNPANDSRAVGFVGGAVKPVDNLASWMADIPVIGPAVDKLGVAMGMPSAKQAVTNNDEMRANNSRTGWQGAGNFFGTLPTLALPGGVFAQGAASGALLSNEHDIGGIGRDALTSALISKGGSAALNGTAAALAPRLSAGAKRLAASGVLQTPGQILSGSKNMIGRGLSKLEEAATSIPYLGDAITMAREYGNESLQRALGNRALGNIGASIPNRVPAGPVMADYVGKRLGRAYDALVPKLHATFDDKFAEALRPAVDKIRTLPSPVQKQYRKILDDVFVNRSNGPVISGQALKDAESQLTYWIKTYGKSANGDQVAMSDALGTARNALRDSITRNNPEFGAQLQALNKGWAQAKVMRLASDGTPDGVPSPARLFQEQRKTGFKDPLIRTAAARLKNATPDSGTARRGMTGLAATALTSGAAGASINPLLAIPAAASFLYTKKGMDYLNKAVFAPRGPVAQGAGKALRYIDKNAVAPAAGLISSLFSGH